jgi:Domain of unknown function (DUF4129)
MRRSIETTGQGRWPAVVVLALTTVAVVALSDPEADISAPAVAVAVGAVTVVWLVVVTCLEYREQHPFPLGILLWRLAPLPTALLAVLLLWLLPDAGSDRPFPGAGETDDAENQGNDQEAPPGNDVAAQIIHVAYAILLAVAIMVSVVVVWRLVRHWTPRRRPPTPTAPGTSGIVAESDDPDAEWREAERRAVRAGLTHGRSALLGEDDPRRAIVRAYLTLEEHVGRAGLVRDPAETQREYAARVLAAGRVADSAHVRDLVELFNAARFSTDPIGPADATAAREHIDALVGS